ncbi:MAG: threonine aldolase family protein [Planctomycetota bacterium]|jgi:threonine aldolase
MATADFRSDTVTRPTPAMREAMAGAEVGDDVFEDDPTVQRLEARIAALFDKPAALFTPSGTMANQIAIGLSVQPGDEILMEEKAHTFHFEVGGAARLWGAQPRLYGSDRGLPHPQEIAAMVRPDNVHVCRTRLCLIENTHNFHGGRVVPAETIAALRRALPGSVRLHLDGARLWNAHVATGTPLKDFAAHADTVMVALSKGLGCPAGSMVIGEEADIAEARRLRKVLGGGMRQVGVLAAPALVALEEGFDHIAADHSRARRLAEGLGVDPALVDSNIVIADVGDAAQAEAQLAAKGVSVVAISPTEIRLVTHKDVGDEDVERAIEAWRSATSS